MYDIILAIITSFCLTYIAIPSIIHVAEKKNLYDEPGERRSHDVKTPSLGGIGIFAGTLFSIILWTPFNFFGPLQYILCSFIIIFLIGARDDIDAVPPVKKLMGQLLAAAILVFKANIKITSFYGILNINELPFFVSILISMFTIIVIINAFNLIDGINGLSASIGILICIVLGFWFYKVNRIEIAIVAFALTGALIAFLRYNITPAKIFMGDTGSLLLGLVVSILAIKFIELHKDLGDSRYKFAAAPSFVIATLILPLFDTMRVFIIRIVNGHSPFYADRNHIHHLFIDSGFSHMQATSILVMGNAVFIIIAFLLQGIGNLLLLIVLIALAIVLTIGLKYYSKNRLTKVMS